MTATDDDARKLVVHDLMAVDLVVSSGSAPPRKRAPRRRSTDSLAKTAVKRGVTITTPDGVTITPKGVEPEATPKSPLDQWLVKRGKQDAD